MPKPPEVNVMFVGKIVGPEMENEADHYYPCPLCGQAVDARMLDQVFYHQQDGHKAKAVS